MQFFELYLLKKRTIIRVNLFAFIVSCISSYYIVPLPLEVIQRIACFLAVSNATVAKIVFPSAEIMLPIDGIYTRASPRTLHNISYPAAVSFGAGYYNRAWVREYNPVTQVRRRNL